MLSQETHRDGVTWGVRLLELQDRGLDPDVIYKLFLTMNLGRDYFAPIQLEERYAETKANFPDVKVAVALLAGKVMLGKYLRNGLALLSQVGVDLDQPLFPR